MPRLLPEGHVHSQLGWLLGAPEVDVPPLQQLFQRCLLDDLTQQASTC